METFRGERCGVDNCRSREYHVDNGLTYCRRGHLQEGRIEQTQDWEDLNLAASQTTRIRSTQEQDEEARREIEKLSGPFGLKLFRLAYEYIMRKHINVLISKKKFPSQFESIVQELWALRCLIALENGLDLDRDAQIDLSTERKPTANRDGSISTLQVDKEDEVPERQLPRFLEMFSMYYVAAVVLRIPLPVSSLYEWIVTDQLMYFNARKEIPKDTRYKFATRFFTIFHVFKPLESQRLHEDIARYCNMLLSRFEAFKLPSLNWHTLLLDHLIRLGLPLHLYTFIESLSRILGIDFSFPLPSGRTWQSYIWQLPSLRLLALIVFAVKFNHPFDSEERYATGTRDTSYLKIDWEEWKKAHTRLDNELEENGRVFSPGEEHLIGEANVPELTWNQIDAYMDWCDHSFLEPDDIAPKRRTTDRTKRLGKEYLSLFPVPHNQVTQSGETERQKFEDGIGTQLMREVYMSLKPRQIISEERASMSRGEVLRPGSLYPRYRNEAELDENPMAKLFHLKVAEKAGISLSTLLRLVWNIESEIQAKEEDIKTFMAENEERETNLNAEQTEETEVEDGEIVEGELPEGSESSSQRELSSLQDMQIDDTH